jgi:hypothetical protein
MENGMRGHQNKIVGITVGQKILTGFHTRMRESLARNVVERDGIGRTRRSVRSGIENNIFVFFKPDGNSYLFGDTDIVQKRRIDLIFYHKSPEKRVLAPFQFFDISA